MMSSVRRPRSIYSFEYLTEYELYRAGETTVHV